MLSRFLRRYGALIAVLSFVLSCCWDAPADWVPRYSYGQAQSFGVR